MNSFPIVRTEHPGRVAGGTGGNLPAGRSAGLSHPGDDARCDLAQALKSMFGTEGPAGSEAVVPGRSACSSPSRRPAEL